MRGSSKPGSTPATGVEGDGMAQQTATNPGLKPAPLKTDVAVDLVGVHKWYGDFHVLRDINLRVTKSERIVICGPSGSGKSTMIRRNNRLEEHPEGRIVVDGRG